VVQDRYDRLIEALEAISWEENQRLIGTTAEVLVSEGEGRKDVATRRLSGRARDGRLVHFQGAADARPGDCVQVALEAAAPHHLTGTATSIRATRAGDAWQAGLVSCAPGPAGTPPGTGATGPLVLGMPGLRPVG
jgi:tRNA-2-methylthio-N6-dimethylallyladenosine synthase